MKRFALGGAAVAVLGAIAVAVAQERAPLAAAQAVEIRAESLPLFPAELEVQTAGKLLYRGGLALRADAPQFGGWSGLIVSADGQEMLAVSDEGNWLRAKLVYRDGALVGVADAQIAPMLGPDGNALSGKQEADAEALTSGSERLAGDIYVSFEQNHRVWRYPFGKDGFNARPVEVAMPPSLKSAEANGGLEGLVMLADGALWAQTEESRDKDGHFFGFVLAPDGVSGQTALNPIPPFQLTDLTLLPNGDVFALERRFSRVGGVGMQARRIARDAIKAGSLIDGAVLADLPMAASIDNMEGASAWRTPEGETRVLLISDDNFNAPLQRTVLLQFAVPD